MVRNSTNATWGFFSNVASEPAATINWSDPGLIWDPIKAGTLTLANVTAATNTTSGALTVAGGAGIAGDLYAGSINTTGTATISNVAATSIYGTFYGTIAGGTGSANVSLYQALTATTTNASFYLPMYDKSTGNAAAFTNTNLTYNPSTGELLASRFTGEHYGTTAQFTNFSTGNAVISGGSATGLTNFSATTGVVTNFSTGNAVISGGYISSLANITATTANFDTSTSAISNATAGNITTLYAGSVNTANAVISGGYISAMSNIRTSLANVTTANIGTIHGDIIRVNEIDALLVIANDLRSSNAAITGGNICNIGYFQSNVIAAHLM
jgi:hypothetical protein